HPLDRAPRARVGLRRHVQLREPPLGGSRGGQIVVGGQRPPQRRRRDVQRRHAIRLQPRAQRERPRAQDLGALHAADRRQPRLHHADQIVGDLVVLEQVVREAQVHGGDLRVGRFHLDGRHLRLGGQIGADLIDARADVGQRLRRVEVQLQADVDRRQTQAALRFDVVAAVGGVDGALQRRGDEAAHEVGAGADVDGPHRHGGALQLRVLEHVQAADRLQAGDDDQHADHDRQHGPAPEQVGDLHGQRFGGCGASCAFACTELSTKMGALLRSLNAPALTTCWPALTPLVTAMKSPRAAPVRTNCWRATWTVLPSGVLAMPGDPGFLSSMTNTESPYDAWTIAVVGNATTWALVGLMTSTVTKLPGRGVLGSSGIAARTFTLRVVGSTVGSMALIVPVIASFAPSIVTRTGKPTATIASSSCGSVKSTNVPPIASSVVTVVPGVRYWPTLTARMPSPPRNSARVVLRSTCARSAAVSVVEVLSCASTSSSCALLMTLPAASLRERSALRVARSRRASTDAICARSTPASSSTRIWPSFAI